MIELHGAKTGNCHRVAIALEDYSTTLRSLMCDRLCMVELGSLRSKRKRWMPTAVRAYMLRAQNYPQRSST
jgi:hypothetical protein